MAKIKRPTAKIVLRKDKILKNGDHPIALRITYDRRSKYFVLKDGSDTMTSLPGKWDVDVGRYRKNKGSNIVLNEYEYRADEVIKKFKDGEFTFNKFVKKYFVTNKRMTVEGYFDEHIAELKKEDKLGTSSVYSDSKSRVKEFVNQRQIYFQDVDEKFVQNFESYLIKQGNSVNSTSIYLRTFRALINRAIKEGYLDEKDYPFKYFTIKTGTATKRALSKDSINFLRKFEAKKDTRVWHSLNYFSFSYLTRGMNLKDMANLTWKDNIVKDRIVYIRAKTSTTTSEVEQHIIKIEKPIAKILKKYPKRTQFVFPILEAGLTELTKRYRIKATLKKISKDITIIANELKIPEADDITFYWARHTYATVLKRSGVPIAVISESLGHKSEKTTQAYLDSFDTETLDATFEHLL